MPQSDTDRIKERLSIVDVVGGYVELTKAGSSFKGLSPFTSEKTPSFFVSPDKGLYHCFSTGKGGDMFTFVQEVEGVDFRGALELLAEKAGIELTGAKGSSDDTDRMRQALAKALQVFEREFEKSASASLYVETRGITKETRASFQIGYAPDSFDTLKKELTDFPSEILVKTGLIRKNERGHTYDYFRDRIMFPLFDASGRIAGFSGRVLDPEGVPKYLNSPDSALYNKSSLLYGLDRAKPAIRTLGCVILVEGQVDLVLSHQAGFENTVAVSGTGLTENHLQTLKHYTDNLILAFDSDRAGINSMIRAARLALPLGFSVKAPVLPKGKDPADIIRENANSWKTLISSSGHVPVALVQTLEELVSDRDKLLRLASRSVFPLLSEYQNLIERDEAIRQLARELDISAATLTEQARSKYRPQVTAPTTPSVIEERNDLYLGLVTAEEFLKGRALTELHSRIEAVRAKIEEVMKPAMIRPEVIAARQFWIETRFEDKDQSHVERFVEDLIIRSELEILSHKRRALARKLQQVKGSDEELTLASEINTLDKERQTLLDKLSRLL